MTIDRRLAKLEEQQAPPSNRWFEYIEYTDEDIAAIAADHGLTPAALREAMARAAAAVNSKRAYWRQHSRWSYQSLVCGLLDAGWSFEAARDFAHCLAEHGAPIVWD